MAQVMDTLSDPAVALKVLAAAAVVLICSRVFLAKGDSRHFPVMGPIEIALTTYIVTAGGIGRRI
jgi:hypothetical protein